MEFTAAGPSQIPAPNVPKPPPIPKKRRIRNAGITILEEFARDHPGTEPNYEQRKFLLEKIHAIPGCADFGNQNLVAWFRRRKASKPIAKSSSRPSSLTSESINYLETLYQAQQEYPSPKLIDTWAVLLKVQPGDIVVWLEAQRSSTGPENVSSPTHHLPTPVSTSPEPLPGSALKGDSEPSVKTDPLNSPVVPSWSFRSSNLPHVHRLSRHSLIQAIVDSTSDHSLPNVKPQNGKEFNDMFHLYVERINTIIEINEEILSSRHTSS